MGSSPVEASCVGSNGLNIVNQIMFAAGKVHNFRVAVHVYLHKNCAHILKFECPQIVYLNNS